MKRSNATSLASNGADDAEIADAIDDDLREAIGPALAAVIDDLNPPDGPELIAEITAFVGIVGQGWNRDGRAEFINLVAGELDALPGHLVLDALARARRRVNEGRILVSWICDDVEPRAARLQAECAMLTRLADLSA